jgi:hypothetical protein
METRQHFVRGKSTKPCSFWRVLWLLPATLACAGTLLANEPMAVLSQHALKFASQPQGTASAPQEIVLSNIGNAELTIASIAIDGENSAEFAETHNCPATPATLQPNAVCQVEVVFKPKQSGDFSATLTVSDNASGSPHTVALSGTSGAAVAVVGLSPPALAFGNQRVGASSKAMVVMLKNTGSARLAITSAIRIEGPASSEFHLQAVHEACPETSGELAPNASCSVGIVFSPVSEGSKSAQLIIEDDAAGSPHIVTLSGSGS